MRKFSDCVRRRYKVRITCLTPLAGTIKEIEIVRMNILERKLSDGRIYHEVAALEKGQRTDRDPYYLISRAQGILDQGINKDPE